jgi:Fibronectin type III domain
MRRSVPRQIATVLALTAALAAGLSSPALAAEVTRVNVRQTSGTGGGVVTFGQVFVAGQVRGAVEARTTGGALLPTQVDVRRRHADGSVRHAILSVDVPGSQTLSLVPTTAASTSTGLTVTQALSGGFDTEVKITSGGKTYTASAAQALRTGPVERWLAGRLVTEYRAPGALLASDGSRLTRLNVLFDVRFLSADEARVSVAVENAWHDTPGDLTYDVQIVSRGGVVLRQLGLKHHSNSRWRQVVLWGAVPTFQVHPDPAYLIAAGAIPRYDLARRRVTAKALDDLWAAWQASNRGLLGNGLVSPKMGAVGGRMDIGLLPTWTVLALFTGDQRAWTTALDSGDRGAVYPVHYRDRATGRPYNIDLHPTASLLNGSSARTADKIPACSSCTSPYTPDTEHQPSLAYLPYLLTGDAYYLEEMEFWVSFNFIKQNNKYRDYAQGLLKANSQTRAQAWTMRNLANAAWIAPDTDPDRLYLEDKLRRNLVWYRDYAVPSNPLGQWGVTVYSINEFPAEVGWHVRNWQIDFFTAVSGWVYQMGYREVQPLRDWLARNVVGRFQNATPEEATAYHLAGGDDNGNWYKDWPTILRLSPEPNSWTPQNPNHYQAHALSALAVAVDAGLSGAATWRNWLETKTVLAFPDRYNADPTWALLPAGAGGTPPPPGPVGPEPSLLPAAPTALTAAAQSGSQVELSWADQSTNEQEFRVEQLDGGTYRQVWKVKDGVTTVVLKGLKGGSSYTFQVRAANGNGVSPASNPATLTMPAGTGGGSGGGGGGGTGGNGQPAPAPPAELTAAALSRTEVQLRWQDRSDNETRFLVEVQIGGQFKQVKSVTAGATSALVKGLAAGTSHTFRVRAYGRGGASAYTNSASAATPR